MPAKKTKGILKWGKETPMKDIEKALEGKVEDPKALAASIRRKALGKKEFSLHQKWGKETDPKKKRELKAKMKVK